MDRQRYIIYRITSPSGKSYIGLTKSKLKERWRQHVKRAQKELNHPFRRAIRKYGAENFAVEEIACAIGGENAGATEIACIAQEKFEMLYNLTGGGENNGPEGSRIFWARMDADPAARAEYIEKLRVASRRSFAENPHIKEAMQNGAKEWRKNNPKEVWKVQNRATRIAAKKNRYGETLVNDKTLATEDLSRPLKERLLMKHKRIFLRRREGTTRMWAERPLEEAKSLSAKIANSVRRYYEDNPEHKARVIETLAKNRAKMDRKHQAAQASKGLKRFWEELKKDPERYAAYMEERTASLMRTLEKKK